MVGCLLLAVTMGSIGEHHPGSSRILAGKAPGLKTTAVITHKALGVAQVCEKKPGGPRSVLLGRKTWDRGSERKPGMKV